MTKFLHFFLTTSGEFTNFSLAFFNLKVGREEKECPEIRKISR
jgi:hypothetical protein